MPSPVCLSLSRCSYYYYYHYFSLSSMVFDFMTLCFQRVSAQYLLWCKRAFSIRLFLFSTLLSLSLSRSFSKTVSLLHQSDLWFLFTLVRLHYASMPKATRIQYAFGVCCEWSFFFWRHVRSIDDFFIFESTFFFGFVFNLQIIFICINCIQNKTNNKYDDTHNFLVKHTRAHTKLWAAFIKSLPHYLYRVIEMGLNFSK